MMCSNDLCNNVLNSQIKPRAYIAVVASNGFCHIYLAEIEAIRLTDGERVIKALLPSSWWTEVKVECIFETAEEANKYIINKIKE